MNLGFYSFLSVILSVGVLGLVRWFPHQFQRPIVVRPVRQRSQIELVFGGVGVACYLLQISLFLTIGINLVARGPASAKYLILVVVAFCFALLSTGAINFMNAVVRGLGRSF
jgi:hypothetical protein